MTDLEEWLSITEAASRLCESGDPVDRSTLSRYLTQHGDALERRRDGKQTLVEFGALRAHRAENIRLRSPIAGNQKAQVAPMRVKGSQSDGLARKVNADAEMREMDLARRRGQLTSVAEVGQAAADSLALMQSAFDRAVETTAASIAVRFGWDERKARIELKAFARLGLETFNRSLRERLDQEARESMTFNAAEIGDQNVLAGSLQ